MKTLKLKFLIIPTCLILGCTNLIFCQSLDYEHANLAFYRDKAGQKQRIKTAADWQKRRDQILLGMQQAMGKDKGIVMDGRDIGTVVFPEAELKLFMTASPETRATRRYKELLEKSEAVTYEEVLRNVEERDRIDSTRTVSPLTKAKDAIEFDNSDMGLEEQFERIHDFAQRVIEKVG